MLVSNPSEALLDGGWAVIWRRRLGRSEALRMVGLALNPSDIIMIVFDMSNRLNLKA